MKFLTIMSWKPENAETITEEFKKWKVPDGMKFLYGPCTVLGGNKSVSIVELNDEAWAKVDRYWRKYCKMEQYPLMDVAELMKITP